MYFFDDFELLIEVENAPSIESDFEEEFILADSHLFGEACAKYLYGIADLWKVNFLILGLSFVVGGLCGGGGIAYVE